MKFLVFKRNFCGNDLFIQELKVLHSMIYSNSKDRNLDVIDEQFLGISSLSLIRHSQALLQILSSLSLVRLVSRFVKVVDFSVDLKIPLFNGHQYCKGRLKPIKNRCISSLDTFHGLLFDSRVIICEPLWFIDFNHPPIEYKGVMPMLECHRWVLFSLSGAFSVGSVVWDPCGGSGTLLAPWNDLKLNALTISSDIDSFKHEFTIDCMRMDLLAADSILSDRFLADAIVSDLPYGLRCETKTYTEIFFKMISLSAKYLNKGGRCCFWLNHLEEDSPPREEMIKALKKEKCLTLIGSFSDCREKYERDLWVIEKKGERSFDSFPCICKVIDFKESFLHDPAGPESVFELVRQNKLSRIISLSDQSLQVIDKNQKTLVHYAAGYNSIDSLGFLLSKEIDPDSLDSNGSTALMMASRFGNVECVKLLLLQSNASIKIKNKKNEDCILLACGFGHLPVLKILHENSRLELDDVVIYLEKGNWFQFDS